MARKSRLERLLPRVEKIARTFKPRNEEREDAIQEARLQLLWWLKTRPEADDALILSSIRHDLIDVCRKEKVRSYPSLDAPISTNSDDGHEETFADCLGSTRPTPESTASTNERNELLQQALAVLLPAEQRIAEMRFGFDGNEPMGQCELADTLRYSQPTLSRRLADILTKLRNYFSARNLQLIDLLPQGV